MIPRMLVVAKAPVPGQVKTRLASTVGTRAAADVAAAALLGTLATVSAAATSCPGQRQLALAGDLDAAVAAEELAAAVAGWRVTQQRGERFGERLAHAHVELPGPVVQIGMDTPQLAAEDLLEVATGLAVHDAVLGPATDGGWWVLALREPRHAAVLTDVPMSSATTYDATLAALQGRGLDVAIADTLRDVDDAVDADLVAREAPDTAFARAWELVRTR